MERQGRGVASVLFSLILACGLSACSRSKAPDPVATAEARIHAIPAANPDKYRGMKDYKGWRNPYLIVRNNGVWLLDVADNEERLVKSDELTLVLAGLPDTAWPYGRVVAVQESAVKGSPDDEAAFRKNKGIVAGTLQGLQVVINWIPTA